MPKEAQSAGVPSIVRYHQHPTHNHNVFEIKMIPNFLGKLVCNMFMESITDKP